MKQIIILISTIFFTSCLGQNNYFEPTGIIDKTEYYAKDAQNWVSLKNKESVDGYTRIGDSIFGGEIACDVQPLKEIDIETFKVLAGTSYAKDKNNVYFPISIGCVDLEDCGVCYFSEIKVADANPKNFKYLGKEYASDGKNAYFRGELLSGADGETFKVISGPEFFYFAKDKNTVYKHNEIFRNADSKTFYYDKTDKRNIVREYEPKYIIGDKNKEWEFIPPNTINEIKKE